MFGGIGDARNLHCTLLTIAGDNSQGKGKDRLFHFTLVDIKPAAIARDLLVFLLLEEVADFGSDMASIERHNLLPCLYYTYLAPVMPRGVYDVLQKRIRTLIDMLEGQRDLPSFLDVPELYRPRILRVLRQWKTEADKDGLLRVFEMP